MLLLNTYSSWLRTNEAFNVCISNVLLLCLFVCWNFPKRAYVCNSIVNGSTVQCVMHRGAHTEFARRIAFSNQINKRKMFANVCICSRNQQHLWCVFFPNRLYWLCLVCALCAVRLVKVHYALLVLLSIYHISWTMDYFEPVDFWNSLCVTEQHGKKKVIESLSVEFQSAAGEYTWFKRMPTRNLLKNRLILKRLCRSIGYF